MIIDHFGQGHFQQRQEQALGGQAHVVAVLVILVRRDRGEGPIGRVDAQNDGLSACAPVKAEVVRGVDRGEDTVPSAADRIVLVRRTKRDVPGIGGADARQEK